jgi:TorA maturation chaperone TorD
MKSTITHPLQLHSYLLLKGVTAEIYPLLKEDPTLFAALPEALDEPDTKHWDTWAADHFHHLGMNVYPNAAMYLDPGGMLGGQVNDQVLNYYKKSPTFYYSESEGADHIGNELAFIVHLLQDTTEEADSQSLTLSSFLHQHLAWWLPVFVRALEMQGDPFFTAVAQDLFKKVIALSQLDSISSTFIVPETLIKTVNPLEDPETRLKDIARFLLTPAQSGMLLTRDRIAAFGRSFRLPRGFGDRLQIMHNLIRTAVDYELVDELLSMVEEETSGWEEFYNSTKQQAPELQPTMDFWLSRINKTRSLLREMRVEIR